MKIRKMILPVFSICLLAMLDQLSKYLAVKNLMFAEDVLVLPHVLSFTYHQNEGAAFGMFQGGRWFFLIFAIIVFIGIGYYYLKLPEGGIYTWVKVFLVIVAAGALGNSTDRLLNGYVVDFLRFEFIDFPIFNVADIYVVCGTILMSITVLFFFKEEP